MGLRTISRRRVVMAHRDDDFEDDSPYKLEGGLQKNCPMCDSQLPPDAVLCIYCGYHFGERRRIQKTIEPVDSEWESGPPFPTRLQVFFACAGIWLLLGLPATQFKLHLLYLLGGLWLTVCIIFGFLFGTFDRLHLKRNRKGKTTLTKTWYICFVPQSPFKITLSEYDGVMTGKWNESGCLVWLIFFAFLPFLIPAIIWWYVAIHQEIFYAALTRDQGVPDTTLYRGWSQERAYEVAKEVANTVGYLHR